ncbi:LapA family protein [Noviherbaspirillum pedocola]
MRTRKNGILGCRFFSRTISLFRPDQKESPDMKLLFRLLAAVLFVLFFGFALKNTQEVALRFFLDYELRGPLVLLLLGFFAIGAVLGVLAMTPMVFRYRRELGKHKHAIVVLQKNGATPDRGNASPPADAY